MRRDQRGFSLATAIFLLVVVATLGAFMLSISITQHYTTAYALQGARAYHAAQSGLQWGIRRALTDGNCTTNFPQNLAPGGALSNFGVTVSCASTNHSEHGSSFNIYVITAVANSTAPAFGEPGFASRQLTTTVTDAPAPGP